MGQCLKTYDVRYFGYADVSFQQQFFGFSYPQLLQILSECSSCSDFKKPTESFFTHTRLFGSFIERNMSMAIVQDEPHYKIHPFTIALCHEFIHGN